MEVHGQRHQLLTARNAENRPHLGLVGQDAGGCLCGVSQRV